MSDYRLVEMVTRTTTRILFGILAALAGVLLWACFGQATRFSAAETEVLRTVVDVPLPGAAVRFDYQSFDPSDGRLYIAHMNADQLVVFDTANRKVVANLDGFHRVHGVIAVPELGRIYASATGDHQVAVVEASNLQTIARIGTINYPDGLAYASTVKRVFVSDEHGDVDAVIDTTTNTLVSSIPLGGGAGNTVYDRVADRIYVAVHGKNELVTIDPKEMKITTRTPMTGLENPHGVALDVENRLAFVAGEGNAKLVVVDLKTMRVGPPFPVGSDPDVLAFDPGVGRLFVSAESGHVTIFREVSGALERLGVQYLPHGHTVAVDPKTHQVYFPLENVKGKPVLRIMEYSGH